jgi:hypothetical protein
LSDEFPNSVSISVFALLHILVEYVKVVIIRYAFNRIVFRWQTVFDVSARYLADLEFHDFLQINIAQVIHNPLDFDMFNVYSGCHIEIVDYFEGHQLNVLPWILEHKFFC